MIRLKQSLRQIAGYPSAIAGIAIIVFLIIVAIYAVVSIPYDEALRLWRGGENVWADNPKTAWPIWYNWFTEEDLPQTAVIRSVDVGEDERVETVVEPLSEDIDEKITIFTLDYPYDAFPQDLILFARGQFQQKQPHVELTWLTPDGREIRVGDFTPTASSSFRFAQQDRLSRRLSGLPPVVGMFADPATAESGDPEPLQGQYQLRVSSLLFEEESDIDTRLVMYGQVHGLAGTDHQRRDLMVALLWGTPIALAFGLLAAVGTTVTTMFIAAVGVWYGGWVDALIQRITEVNLVLPVLPILIMVGTFYSRSIWLMLGVIIVLSIFGASIKSYRAIFLQVKESPYIEAARAYGASSVRIILNYLVPRILPLIIPSLVVLVPSFVFLEASLAVLGLGDPVLPTWGKLINDARTQGALFNGYYYWIIEPAFLLMLAGLGFALVGFALDRVFNPRLREL
ncbi:MAG: ABC transporter permease [Candidatus Promineifilaceae bacterium]|nr:ABC transporter permease [Candidatus Promineifilaceae bacterium]